MICVPIHSDRYLTRSISAVSSAAHTNYSAGLCQRLSARAMAAEQTPSKHGDRYAAPWGDHGAKACTTAARCERCQTLSTLISRSSGEIDSAVFPRICPGHVRWPSFGTYKIRGKIAPVRIRLLCPPMMGGEWRPGGGVPRADGAARGFPRPSTPLIGRATRSTRPPASRSSTTAAKPFYDPARAEPTKTQIRPYGRVFDTLKISAMRAQMPEWYSSIEEMSRNSSGSCWLTNAWSDWNARSLPIRR
jgi:hypothetical protein